jgi:hypothetical protein
MTKNKPKRGRPRLADPKVSQLQIRMTPARKSQFLAWCEDHGTSASKIFNGYVDLLLGEKKEESG